MRFSLALILSITLSIEACATSMGWNGEPIIKSINNLPAICLPNYAKEDFPVSRVVLSESYVNTPLIWTIKLKKNATPLILKAGECIRSFEIPNEYELDENSNLDKLQKNTTYVFMMDRINDAKYYNYFYSSSFCIEGDTPEKYKYSQYVRLPDGSSTIPACDAKSKRDTPLWGK